jgi:hypothetical protein
MADLNVRSDSVNVEQIMKQIRTRIREKRGSDYTQAELQQLASAKLEQFADPSGLRSDLLDQFRKRGDEPSTYHRHRGVRRLLLMIAHPILKRVQKQLMADLNLYFEIIHNLVVETTRLGIEVQNLKMRVESLSSRVDFDERRAKSLEGVVQYRQNRPPSSGPAGGGGSRSSGPSTPAFSPAPSGSSAPVSTVSYANVSVNAASTAPAASSGSSPAAAPGPAVAGIPGASGPAAQGAPGSSRRRRRRRRRRPGNTLADSPNAGSNQQSSSPGGSGGAAPNNGGTHDDGPDGDDDGGDGDEGAEDK